MAVKFSLKKKIALFMIASIVFMGCASVLFFEYFIRNMEEEEYRSQSIDLASTVATVVDVDRAGRLRESISSIYDADQDKVSNAEWGSPKYDAYLTKYASVELSEDFEYLREQLREIQKVNDVESLFLMYIDVPTKSVVYMVDAGFDNVRHPGTFEPIEGDDLQVFEQLDKGFDPSITNTDEHGWIVATAKPIIGKNGSVVAYACVSISMNKIVGDRYQFLSYVVAGLLALTVLTCAVGILLFDRSVVRPVNALTQASLRYYSPDERQTTSAFDDLDIHTGDEIEILANAMVKMERDVKAYEDELRHVANSDSLTRVRNKRAYDVEARYANEEIQLGQNAIGLAMVDMNFLKQINDTYGHERGDIALKAVCALVCRIFDHSPVFRVGGDEFVVVLRGHDLECIDELVAQFNSELDSMAIDSTLEPWERVSAAIGYSVFDPAYDKDLTTVYMRADKAMYERKRAMKAGR